MVPSLEGQPRRQQNGSGGARGEEEAQAVSIIPEVKSSIRCRFRKCYFIPKKASKRKVLPERAYKWTGHRGP